LGDVSNSSPADFVVFIRDATSPVNLRFAIMKRIKLTESLGDGVYIDFSQEGVYVAASIYLYPQAIVAIKTAVGAFGKPYSLVYVENRSEPFKIVETPEEIDRLCALAKEEEEK
jgi:hypothetical protein